MKILRSLCFFMTLPVFFCGCRGTEVQDRKYAEYVYIEAKNNNVYAKIHFFQSDDTAEGSGNSLSEALVECSKNSGADIFAGHMEYAVLNTNSPFDILVEMKKDCDLPDSCRLIYSDKNVDIPAKDLAQIEEYEKTLSLPVCSISNSLDALLSPYGTCVFPSIQNDSFSASVISPDGKLFTLGENAVKGLALFQNGTKSTWLFVDSNSYDVYSIKRNIKVSVRNDILHLTFCFSFKCNDKNISLLEDDIAFCLQKYISETIKKGCGISNTADLIQQKEYSFYKNNKDNFDEVYKNSVCNVCVNGRIYNLQIN